MLKYIYHLLPMWIWEALFLLLMIVGFTLITILGAWLGQILDKRGMDK